MIDSDILSTKEPLLHQIRRKLGTTPLDYSDMCKTIQESKQFGMGQGAAGVLLLLHNRQIHMSSGPPATEFVLQLIKRSGRVSQGGDISCPGGMLHPSWDRGLAFLIRNRIIPAFLGLSRVYASQRSADTYRLINLFLANAMRESWEEIRLNPFNVEFLGPLPTYSLSMFRRTIFPLVAFARRPWIFRPNIEVDKVIEIPLVQFFAAKNYAWFTIASADTSNAAAAEERDFPCFVHQENDSQREILWGATFNIIMNFLKVVFGFSLPDIATNQQYRRVLSVDYAGGRRKATEGE